MTAPDKATAARLAERMRMHVNSRGGPAKDKHSQAAIPNGAWQMMLDAADLLDTIAAHPDDGAACEHNFVDARNQYVHSGSVCFKCGAVKP